LKKRTKPTYGIGGWNLQQPSSVGSEGTLYKTRYEIASMKIAKQMAGVTSCHQKVKAWTLWRGRPLPKWKKYLPTLLV
jgi:hypothetical protein